MQEYQVWAFIAEMGYLAFWYAAFKFAQKHIFRKGD
jgi:hypothetical protein